MKWIELCRRAMEKLGWEDAEERIAFASGMGPAAVKSMDDEFVVPDGMTEEQAVAGMVEFLEHIQRHKEEAATVVNAWNAKEAEKAMGN